MITMLGSPRRCCDGLTLLGGAFNLPSLFAAQERRPADANPGKAKSVILLNLLGGAATQDMFDLKPDAPDGVRSEFKPIDTNVPGVRICEHLPRMAKWMHRAAIVRSVNHKAGCHNCLPLYTGFEVPQPDQHPRDSDPPSMGSVCEYLNKRNGEFPAYAFLPCWLGWGQAFRRAGPYAGFLGKRFDPLTAQCEPFADPGAKPAPGAPAVVRGVPFLADSTLPEGVTIDRLDSRRSLLQQLDDQLPRAEAEASAVYDRTRRQAFDLLTSSKVRAAFELKDEEPRLLDRYGRTLFGHSTVIARRLVERGVRFVNVTWDLFWDRIKIDYDAWDTHTKNFPILRDNKLPHLDQTFSALMEDLEARGLLDETLVVLMSEMGRTPRVNPSGGRDHWTFCYAALLAGAGIRGGTVYGSSDSQAAYVKDLPVSPADLCATIYHCLGIDPEMTVPDRSGKPVPVAQGGHPVREILV
jgi:hypothetical protein